MHEKILYDKHIKKERSSHMEWIQGMNEAVNYIEEHILEEPDVTCSHHLNLRF